MKVLAINNGAVEVVPRMVEDGLPGLIGSKIRARRDKLGLKQNDLARRLDVTFQAVSKWERGENAPDITLLSGLARELQVTVDWLVGRDLEAFARECYLFDGLDDGDIRLLLEYFACEYHPADARIYVADAENTQAALYLIESGRVRIEKDGATLHEVGPGELFSDTSLFTGGPCLTSATTTEAACLHRLSAGDLRKYTERYPEQANHMLWNELRKVAGFFRDTE